RDACRAAQVRHAVLLEQGGDAGRQTLHDFVLPPHHRREVELDPRDLHAVSVEAVLGLGEGFARIEQRLGGNAPDAQTGAAERGLFLDARDVHAELRRADRVHVAPGARTDDDQVVTTRFRHDVFYRFARVRVREGGSAVRADDQTSSTI